MRIPRRVKRLLGPAGCSKYMSARHFRLAVRWATTEAHHDAIAQWSARRFSWALAEEPE